MNCHVPIGKLISHPCDRYATGQCSQCQKPFCEKHAGPAGNCAVCSGAYTPPAAPIVVTPGELLAFTPGELDAFDRSAGGTGLGGQES